MKRDWVDAVLSTALRGAASAAARISPFLAKRHDVERISGLAFGSHGLRLDVYRPKTTEHKPPVVIFVHGGGFRFFSKDSHSHVAARIASLGNVALAVDYRLTPGGAFPESLIDLLEAYEWATKNSGDWGGNPDRIHLVGESAGANLCLALLLHLHGVRRLEGAPDLRNRTFPSRAVLHCGLMRVSNVRRFETDPQCHPVALSRLRQIQKSYLPQSWGSDQNADYGLADPGVVLEKLRDSESKLPAGFARIFAPVGSNDPILNDSLRLQSTLSELGHDSRCKVYPGQGHAFYVNPFSRASDECWRDIAEFLKAP